MYSKNKDVCAKISSFLKASIVALLLAGCASTTPTIQLNDLPTGSIDARTFAVIFTPNSGNQAWDMLAGDASSSEGFQSASGENGNEQYYKTPEELLSYYESKRAEFGYQGISLTLHGDQLYSPEEHKMLLKLYELCDRKNIPIYVLKLDGTLPKFRKLTLQK
jgi:hypothetical protein